jgi:hypothetical protein
MREECGGRREAGRGVDIGSLSNSSTKGIAYPGRKTSEVKNASSLNPFAYYPLGKLGSIQIIRKRQVSLLRFWGQPGDLVVREMTTKKLIEENPDLV